MYIQDMRRNAIHVSLSPSVILSFIWGVGSYTENKERWGEPGKILESFNIGMQSTTVEAMFVGDDKEAAKIVRDMLGEPGDSIEGPFGWVPVEKLIECLEALRRYVQEKK